MRLNFTVLSEPMQEVVGHSGTGGTASNHAAFHRPTMRGDTWDAVGQTTALTIEAQTERQEMSHLSHHGQNKVGRKNPSIDAGVPLVPPVPPKKHMDEIDREAFEERAAIMEFDGSLPRGEAERMAAQALLARADATCDKGDGDIEPPFTPTVRQPFAPLSASEEAAIRTWLALIEEIDPATIAEVIEHCQRDSEARSYFTRRAAFDLLNAGFVTDAARFHQKQ